MRIFPPPWEGLHPAFPYRPETSSHPVLALSPLGGVGGVLFLSVAKVLHYPPPYATPRHVAAYGLVVTSVLGCILRGVHSAAADAFLQGQGVQVPRGKFFDRLEFFDRDNAIVIGAIASVIRESRRMHSPVLSGWRRWAGAAAYGCLAGEVFYLVFKTCSLAAQGSAAIQANTKQAREVLETRRKWAPQVQAAFRKTLDERIRSLGSREGIPMASMGLPSGTGNSRGANIVHQNEQSKGSKDASASPPKLLTAHEKIGFDGLSWENRSNLPHLTLEMSSEPEPIPYANTNYLWAPAWDKGIVELEVHISKLRQRRQELANECEHLWRWLAEKELEYYNFDSSQDKDEKLRKRRYLEALGDVHTKVWVEVSKCDWMIADSQKNIAQLRSAIADGKQYTWLPPISEEASATEPRESDRILKYYYEHIKARKQAIEEAQATLAEKLSQPDLLIKPGKTQDPVTGEWVDNAQLYQRVREACEIETKSASLDAEAFERVLKDVEERKKEARSRGKE